MSGTNTGNAVDVLNKLISDGQESVTVIAIVFAVVGSVAALTAGYKLWMSVHYEDPGPKFGLVLGVIIGSLITITCIIAAWFSLIYTNGVAN